MENKLNENQKKYDDIQKQYQGAMLSKDVIKLYECKKAVNICNSSSMNYYRN